MANAVITPSAVYRASSDSAAWAAEDFRTGYASGNNWRSKLVLPIGNLAMGKSNRLVVGLSPYDYTVWPGTIRAVLTDNGDLTPAQVMSSAKVGSYQNGAHADLLAASIAQSVAYSDEAGTSAIAYSTSMKKGETFYFVFDTTALKANKTYYVYAMRDCSSGSYAGFTVIDDLSYITASLTYEDTYTVTFDGAGIGTAPAPMTVDAGGSMTLPTMEADGFLFRGWAETAGAAEGMTGTYTPTASVTLYAVWAAACTVSFHANGHGTAPGAVTVAQGETVELPVMEAEGYSFLGWAESQSATAGMTGSYTPTTSVTLYAVWKSRGSVVMYNQGGTALRCYVYANVDGKAVRCRVRYNNNGTVVEV